MTTKSSRAALAACALAVALLAGALAAREVWEDDTTPPPIVLTGSPAGAPPSSTPDDDLPLTREEAARAIQAALEITGGGTVTEADRSDDPGEAYELEVVREGREIDVALDARFRPVPNRRYAD